MSVHPKRGEIWMARLPDDPKVRPAVIISRDPRNEHGNSVIAIPITTNLKPANTHVRLPAGQGGLRQDSVARCENVVTVLKSRLSYGPLAGTVSQVSVKEIEDCLQRALGIKP